MWKKLRHLKTSVQKERVGQCTTYLSQQILELWKIIIQGKVGISLQSKRKRSPQDINEVDV